MVKNIKRLHNDYKLHVLQNQDSERILQQMRTTLPVAV